LRSSRSTSLRRSSSKLSATGLGVRRFDLLFVNAGVTNRPEETTADVTTEEFTRLMVTNALSPMRVIEVLGELIGRYGTIAIMSSGQGSIANNERVGFEIYRARKSALNQLKRSYAAVTTTTIERCF
jgi:NAD(P)-dependent dehydrogenase (short-subunit alcohol dehydrogenase family)